MTEYNPDGTWERGIGEASLANARPGELYQFERYGFVRVEDVQPPDGRPLKVCFGHP